MKKDGMIQPSEPWPRPVSSAVIRRDALLEVRAAIKLDKDTFASVGRDTKGHARALMLVEEILATKPAGLHVSATPTSLHIEGTQIDSTTAVLSAEPARGDGTSWPKIQDTPEWKAAQDDAGPEPGDLVISASSQAVQWNGLPDPWYWTAEDAVAMQDETIVVIRRAAEIKRMIEQARP